jgi:hypothetical protein
VNATRRRRLIERQGRKACKAPREALRKLRTTPVREGELTPPIIDKN